MQLLLTTAARKSIETNAIQNRSKLSDSGEKQRVSPSKNFSVCPWVQLDQPLNRVYAKKIVSPNISHFEIRPQSMRVRQPISKSTIGCKSPGSSIGLPTTTKKISLTTSKTSPISQLK